MSKGHSETDLFVDTGLLRDHVSKLREEKKSAARLYEHVVAMRNNSDPTIAYQYAPILRDIKQLMEYYDRMVKLFGNIADEATELSNKLGAIIKNDTEYLHQTISNNFML